MLCMTLKEGDVVVIGDVRMRVNRVKPGEVRLAIDLPDHVVVERLPAPEIPEPEVVKRVVPWVPTVRRGGIPR